MTSSDAGICDNQDWINAVALRGFFGGVVLDRPSTKRALICLRAAALLLSGCTGLLTVIWAPFARGDGQSGDTGSSAAMNLPPKVQSVLDAYGGIEALRRHRELPLRSHLTIETSSQISSASNKYDCELVEQGNRLRAEMSMLDVPLVLAYDGTASWTKYGDWVSPAAPSASEQIAEELQHGLRVLADLGSPSVKVEMLPAQLVHDRLCDRFIVTASDGRTDIFAADPQTHLILRDDYTAVDHELGTKTNQTIEYSDYRPAASSLEPFHLVQYSGGRKRSETIVQSMTVDQSIDDGLFRMPPESSIPGLAQTPIVIPFEYSGNQIVIKARINNGDEQHFIIDSGASQTVIDEATAAALGPHPASTFSITAGSKAMPLGYTKIPSLSLGDLTLHDIPAFIKDLSDLNEHPAGLIGANVLRRFLVTIDFENNRLILADPRTAQAAGDSVIVPAVSVFGGTALVVKAKVDERSEINCLVDTGASFNNLPQSLGKLFFSGPLNSIGVIFGLDGQRLNIASIRCRSLTLGGAAVSNPVFTVTPDGITGQDGLFTASTIGILGNPVWSQFKTTIDYRHERLLLERQPGQDKFRHLVERLDAITQDYLRTKDVDQTIKSLDLLLADANNQKEKDAQALIISQAASCLADKFTTTREGKYLDQAGKLFERADKTANESCNRSVQGRVLAQWALMYLNSPRTMRDITLAQSLVAKALQKAPMEANIFAAFGATLVKAGKPEEAEKVLDRALVLDPANWEALWSKYRLCRDEQRRREQNFVAAQLQRYYPSYPDVLKLVNHD